MKRDEVKLWNTKAVFGLIPDDLNPIFIFSLTANELLSKIAKGEINSQELAKRELENRGMNIDGQWVGFKHEIL
jgi:hypothetical protein